MPANLLHDWSNFFVAELGAAAALAGLLFVAISINLTRILEFQHLPARAAEALLTLLSVLFVSSFALVPGQSLRAVGFEIAATGAFTWIVLTLSLLRLRKFDRKYVSFTRRALLNQLPALTFVVSGVLLAVGRPSGIYWTVPGALLSFASGIFGAWVLLVEIQR